MDEVENRIEMIEIELGTSLIQDGFKLINASIRPVEKHEELVLEYAKAVDSGNGWRKVKMCFTLNPNPLDEFFIYIEVESEQTGMFLGTMRALQDDFLSLNAGVDQMRWTYTNMEEFAQRLREIRQLMEDKLFAWFEDSILAPYNRKS
jgi:hypothetical protein